jgi:hypothetical protein
MKRHHNGRYILDEELREVPCPDLLKWARWLETSDKRRVGDDRIGPYWVSTIFLGLDHNYGQGEPLLYETMIFKIISQDKRTNSGFVARYPTYATAQKMHTHIVELIKEGRLP